MLKDTILVTGFPHELGEDDLKGKLPEKFQQGITKVHLISESVGLVYSGLWSMVVLTF